MTVWPWTPFPCRSDVRMVAPVFAWSPWPCEFCNLFAWGGCVPCHYPKAFTLLQMDADFVGVAFV